MPKRKHESPAPLAVVHPQQLRQSPAIASSTTARAPSLNFSIESIMNNSPQETYEQRLDGTTTTHTNSSLIPSDNHKAKRQFVAGEKSIRSMKKRRLSLTSPAETKQQFGSRSPSPAAHDGDDDDEICSQRTSLSGSSNLTCAQSSVSGSRASSASSHSSRASTPISPGCNSINLVDADDAAGEEVDVHNVVGYSLGQQQHANKLYKTSNQHQSLKSSSGEHPNPNSSQGNQNTTTTSQSSCEKSEQQLNSSQATAKSGNNVQQQHKSAGGKSRNSSSSGGSGSWSKERSGGGGGSTNHLLRQPVCTDPRLSPFECHLDNLDLWHRFHPLDTEMIITKQGRRMFPPVRVNFTLNEQLAANVQLNPRDKYQVLMDILPYDNKRYRYAYHKSSWQQAGKADPPSPTKLFLHPDGPFTLDQLKRQVISFEKIKLTNNDANKHGYIVLNSMHKYQPRIHLVLWRGRDSQNLANSPIVLLDQEQHKTFIFSETIFTAVTAYQNHSITKLKIDSNPFAKGFRDSSRLTDLELESMQDLITADGQCQFSPPRAPPAGFPHFLFAAAAAQQQHSMAVGGPKMGGEDPTSALLRERTIMALDSFLQQQQQQHQNQSSSPHSPAASQRSAAGMPISVSSAGPAGHHLHQQFGAAMNQHAPPPLPSVHQSSPMSQQSNRQTATNSPPPFGNSFLGPPPAPQPAPQSCLHQQPPPPPPYGAHHHPLPPPHSLGQQQQQQQQQQQIEQFIMQQQQFAAAMAAAMAVSGAHGGHPFQHLFAQMGAGGGPLTTGVPTSTTTAASNTTSCSMTPANGLAPGTLALHQQPLRPSPGSGACAMSQSGSSSPASSATPQLGGNGNNNNGQSHSSPTIDQQSSPIGAAKSAARQQAEQLSMLSSSFSGNALGFLGPSLGGANEARGPHPPPPYGYHSHSLQAMIQQQQQQHHHQQMAAMSMQKRLDQQQQQSTKVQDKK